MEDSSLVCDEHANEISLMPVLHVMMTHSHKAFPTVCSIIQYTIFYYGWLTDFFGGKKQNSYFCCI